jgi:hypothetical protein
MLMRFQTEIIVNLTRSIHFTSTFFFCPCLESLCEVTFHWGSATNPAEKILREHNIEAVA